MWLSIPHKGAEIAHMLVLNSIRKLIFTLYFITLQTLESEEPGLTHWTPVFSRISPSQMPRWTNLDVIDSSLRSKLFGL